MEVSSTFQRCTRQVLARPACRRFESRTPTTSRPAQQFITRNSLRSFSSTPRSQQHQAQQAIPVSNEIFTDKPADSQASSADGLIKPDPKNRIDLSSITSNPNTYKPPGLTSTPGSAREKMNALFGSSRPSQENRFDRTIRQTDALNSTSSTSKPQTQPTLNIKSFLDNIGFPSSSSPSKSKADHKLPLRLRPTLGRTIPVDTNRGVDVTRAFRQVDMKCAANNLRKDANAQRFHVRRGQARKLQRSLRWRVQFRAGFLEECARIRRMKNQGW